MTEITQADRATAHTWWMHREHDERDLPAYFANHREAAAAEERTKIVAWLRERDGFNDCYSELKDQWLSDRIARGEHLK